ncbi:uncharacterized protein EI90DRAFT_3068348 [Cantharellus anzutake]|uniref:uncharacterized protein n=1 Tax=Cantharellus anzutake TaxID=1750568 RepID=UPI0019079A16|nr:uncharacterized protein EI90DRAFT_3068348 [Cantharellus anzutake]KAF8327223.1 hypothetical protein EI90DRAFT_3068348 [Cantharellus anzutake]
MSKHPPLEAGRAGPSTPLRKDVTTAKQRKSIVDDDPITRFTAGFASNTSSSPFSIPIRKPGCPSAKSKELFNRDAKDFAQFLASNSKRASPGSKPASSSARKTIIEPPFTFPDTPTQPKKRKSLLDPFSGQFTPDVSQTPHWQKPFASLSSRLDAAETIFRDEYHHKPVFTTPTRPLPAPIPLSEFGSSEGDEQTEGHNRIIVTPLTARIVDKISFPRQRGLGLSPSKTRRLRQSGGNHHSLTRNGLAERASSLIQSYEMRIALWQGSITHANHSVNPAASKTKSRHPTRKPQISKVEQSTTSHKLSTVLKPDLRFLVIHVCGCFEGLGKDSRSFTLTRCRVLKQEVEVKLIEQPTDPETESQSLNGANQSTEAEVEVKHTTSTINGAEETVLFSSLRRLGVGRASGIDLMHLDNIRAGSEVVVWRPWHQVPLKAFQGEQRTVGTEDQVMLCSRFAVRVPFGKIVC